MTPGHDVMSALAHHVIRAASAPPAPSPGITIPVLPQLPPGIVVPRPRTGQIVAAAFAIVLDTAGLAAVGVGALVGRHRRRAS